MPTTRERVQVTVSDELAIALDALAREHPTEARSQLLTRLALRGAEAAKEAAVERKLRRLEALWDLTHNYADMYPPGYLEELRRDGDGRP